MAETTSVQPPQQEEEEEEQLQQLEEQRMEPDEGAGEVKKDTQTTPTRPLLCMRSMSSFDTDDDSPNMIAYRKWPDTSFLLDNAKIEDIVTRIQDETDGVPIRTLKSFMTKIPSVVTGADIVQWFMKNLLIEDPAEAMHIGSLIAAQGYFFPVSDHILSLRDDGTYYRFQAPYFWPSHCWEPENTDYAIYLCKRTMQNKTRLELADYEAENLARLQSAFARKWEFIYMQAEAQVKVDRKKDKTERKILDSQERAFWDVHRPVLGCVNTTEMDIRKCRRKKNPQKFKTSVYGLADEGLQSQSPVHTPSFHGRKGTKNDVEKEILFLHTQLQRHCMRMSKVAESLISYTEQYLEYDPFVTAPEPPNPWTSDDGFFWDLETSKDLSQWRVKKWGFSLGEALKDPAGRDLFLKFLESEFSSENLQFWLAVQDLKKRPQQEVAQRTQEIWEEFLAEGAPSSINLDSHSYELTSHNLKDPGRYSYEDAQGKSLTGKRLTGLMPSS
ncbi:regulator of G-protein signaling 6-like [Thalassophryne amazonica]|uniref:regulator of G-protein signaling 6-like n=1 Tax=Thalassophryne amazonica TaxID=390379 RepID=UPI0014719C9D|nr:regulator of G-protein signaling 6-like [Thalassophryne amazonica]